MHTFYLKIEMGHGCPGWPTNGDQLGRASLSMSALVAVSFSLEAVRTGRWRMALGAGPEGPWGRISGRGAGVLTGVAYRSRTNDHH